MRLACLALVALASPAALAQISPCAGLKVTSAPRERATDAKPQGGLVKTPANPLKCGMGVPLKAEAATLWRCRVEFPDDVDPPEGAPTDGFMVERAGKITWSVGDSVMAGGYDIYDLISVDLDGDGTRENLVQLWNAQGNGLGVNTWTVHIFKSDWTHVAELDSIQEWGRSSIVKAPKSRKGCDLASTEWTPSVNKEGVEGISLKATFHQYKDGKLSEAADRKPIQRRYTFAFQRERTAHFRAREDRKDANEADIAKWLSNKATAPSP